MILSLGFYWERVRVKERYVPPSKAQIWPIIFNNLETVRDGMWVSVNHYYGKLHMGFRCVPKSASLSDPERHNGRYFALGPILRN